MSSRAGRVPPSRAPSGRPGPMASERKRKLEVYEGSQQNGAAAVGQQAVNPYTNKLYSQKYYDILAKRRGPCTALHRVCV